MPDFGTANTKSTQTIPGPLPLPKEGEEPGGEASQSCHKGTRDPPDYKLQ